MTSSNRPVFTKRFYTPAALMADLHYLMDHANEVRTALSGNRVSKALGKRIVLAVTAVNRCRYCSYGHAKTATLAGVTTQEAHRLLRGDVGLVPEAETPAVLFAQHYAESGGCPDPSMLEALENTYGPDTANDILVHIRMITMGNLSGNTFDALLSRMQGRPAAGSRLVDETISLGLLLAAPLIAAANLARRAIPTLHSRESALASQKEVEMKTLIYGAGVLGSLYAARLSQSGQDVTLLARGARARELREYGILLEDLSSGVQTSTPVQVVERVGPEDRYDLAIVCLPKDHTAEVLPSLAANAHVPSILFLGNNAAGPEEYVNALGAPRVLLGFPGGAGTREEGVVRYVDSYQGRVLPVHIGQPDGKATPRLACIAAAFRQAGIPVIVEPNMDAWLRSHAAIILPLASALYMADGDPFRLARTRDGLVLVARAFREASHVLDILGIRLIPPRLRLLQLAPEPLFVAALRRSLQRPFTQICLSHAEASRAEVEQLATEFSTLASQANFSTPVMDYLHNYVNPSAPPMSDGSAQLGVNWRNLWIALGLVAGGSAALKLLGRTRRRHAA